MTVMESEHILRAHKMRLGLMTKIKLRDIISLNTFTVLSAIALCVVLVTDPSLLG